MFSFCRQCYLVILCIIVSPRLFAQSSQCDSIEWKFGVNQFAIDGDNLLADLADKGWDQSFFQTKQVEVTIYGATDCPGSLAYNTKLAGNRALYLRNYFEVSEFPALTIADSYAIPERNCSRPGQGYNPADRVTHLRVCWSDAGVTASVTKPTEQLSVVDNAKESEQHQEEKTSEETEVRESQGNIEQPTELQDSTSTQINPAGGNEVLDSAIAIIPERIDTPTFILPTKPKKTLSVERTEDLNTGDEVIVEGLNFYPGSHRTLPEAKPILKKLLDLMQNNPAMMIEIQGHVCCASKPNDDGLDDETGDFRLSWNRAQFVRDYLVQNGIDASRITYRGYAMTHPLVYPEITIQDQIKNRRVEILITAE
jgi:outer membrane protein OmpA-like peptidoglycan-associated protein